MMQQQPITEQIAAIERRLMFEAGRDDRATMIRQWMSDHACNEETAALLWQTVQKLRFPVAASND
ncbi:hypothetical protein HU230_0006395 [Bradyrhizobium quebecense]|uniref:Uncharacterized protein n=1 Tax=Bradyrhizobium quebecense TaxID=2748629 RepID=A0A974AFU3_9BRAD|nr:hypothetical protein [Bradyrhizobium quebecense]UGA45665.1 hypothetical protein HU230_0006395 [Bradyrhizobium quebecense]